MLEIRPLPDMPTSNSTEIQPNPAGNSNRTFKAKVVSHPAPTITWRTNTGEEFQLPFSSNEMSKFYATNDEQGTTFTIQNVSVRDAGVYTLIVDNKFDRKEEFFELQVHGIFIDQIQIQIVYQLMSFIHFNRKTSDFLLEFQRATR